MVIKKWTCTIMGGTKKLNKMIFKSIKRTNQHTYHSPNTKCLSIQLLYFHFIESSWSLPYKKKVELTLSRIIFVAYWTEAYFNFSANLNTAVFLAPAIKLKTPMWKCNKYFTLYCYVILNCHNCKLIPYSPAQGWGLGHMGN